jgi:hypothetical protein
LDVFEIVTTQEHISTQFVAEPDGIVSVKKKEDTHRQQDQSKRRYL